MKMNKLSKVERTLQLLALRILHSKLAVLGSSTTVAVRNH